MADTLSAVLLGVGEALEGVAVAYIADDQTASLAGSLGERWSVRPTPSPGALAAAINVDAARITVVIPPSRVCADDEPARCVVETLAVPRDDDCFIGTVVPGRYLTSPRQRDLRERIERVGVPVLIVEAGAEMFGSPGTTDTLAAFLLIGQGSAAKPPTRFVVIPPDGLAAGELTKEVRRILSKPARTAHGWVVGEVTASTSLEATHYSPQARRAARTRAEVGQAIPLSGLVEQLTPVDLAAVAETAGAVTVLSAVNISRDGALRLGVFAAVPAVAESQRLQVGDLCVKRMVGPRDQALAVHEVNATSASSAVDDTVVALRVRTEVQAPLRLFIREYLRAPQTLTTLRTLGVIAEITDEHLKSLPIVVPQTDTSALLTDLWRAESLCGEWIRGTREIRATLAEAGLTDMIDLRDVVRRGRRAIQRIDAGRSMDDVDRRLSAQLPLPLAIAWREIYTESPDLAYSRLLALAENLTAYLSVLGIAASRHAGVELSSLSEFRQRTASGQGFGFGDWSLIVDEMQGSGYARKAGESFPLREMNGALPPGGAAASALGRLRARRNDMSHLRGPQGPSELKRAYDEARDDLLTLFDAVDFITDYPLRLVEATQWDSLEGNNRYTYRDLMGDHPVVKRSTARSADSDIEAGSLYLVYRDESLCLLRPMLILSDCACGATHTFVIDTIGGDGISRMRALELTHTIDIGDLRPAFAKIGLIEPLQAPSDGNDRVA